MTLHVCVLVVTALVLCAGAIALWFWTPGFGFALMEDAPVEWLEFYCLVGAGLAFFEASRRSIAQKSKALVFAGLGLLCLFVAGEEVSWGQRILGFTPPGYFAYHNVQREVTIHNLQAWWMRPSTAALAFMLGYGILLPAMRLLIPSLPAPPWGALPAFVAATSLFTQPISGNDDEVGELLFAIAMLAAGVDAMGLRGREGGGFFGRFVAAFALVSVITSWASFQSSAEREHAAYVGHLRIGQAYEGLNKPGKAARHYERLARYWGSDWDLWVKVVTLYRQAGELRRAYDLAAEMIRVHRREPRLFATLMELGDSLAIPDDARERILEQYEAALAEENGTFQDEKDLAFLEGLVRARGWGEGRDEG